MVKRHFSLHIYLSVCYIGKFFVTSVAHCLSCVCWRQVRQGKAAMVGLLPQRVVGSDNKLFSYYFQVFCTSLLIFLFVFSSFVVCACYGYVFFRVRNGVGFL